MAYSKREIVINGRMLNLHALHKQRLWILPRSLFIPKSMHLKIGWSKSDQWVCKLTDLFVLIYLCWSLSCIMWAAPSLFSIKHCYLLGPQKCAFSVVAPGALNQHPPRDKNGTLSLGFWQFWKPGFGPVLGLMSMFCLRPLSVDFVVNQIILVGSVWFYVYNCFNAFF